METTELDTIETLQSGELVYRAIDPANITVGAQDEGVVVEGRMMPYDEWTEVRSSVEGHFMERFMPGALAKTMVEQAAKVRALFEHGLDAAFGRQAIASIDEMREEPDGAYFRATLLAGIPTMLVDGLRKGLYGSSIRFEPMPGKWERVRSPRRSEHNPQGIPEITVREAFLKEFSITPFPVYAGATAGVRSITDEIAAKQLLGDPSRLLEILSTTTSTKDEPQHSVREEQEEPVPERSRSTQPQRDYLNPNEEDPKWLL